jgi:hypothetical protein
MEFSENQTEQERLANEVGDIAIVRYPMRDFHLVYGLSAYHIRATSLLDLWDEEAFRQKHYGDWEQFLCQACQETFREVLSRGSPFLRTGRS